MNKCFIFILLLASLGCSTVKTPSKAYKSSDKESIANEIMSKTTALLKKEKNLQPFGSGGQTMHEVKMLALAFAYNKPIEIEKGRKLLVYAIETFVSQINNDERIHPYLYKYPFEPKNVEVEIYLNKPNGYPVEPEKICVLIARRGMIEYKVEDSTTSRLKTIYEESFDEAQKKVKENESL